MAESIARHCNASKPVTLHSFYIGDLDFDYEFEARKIASSALEIRVKKIENPFDENDLVAYQNPAYFLRLAIADLLPELKRVIYLDVDLLVKSELSALFEIDLKGAAIGAVEDSAVKAMLAAPTQTQSIHTITVVVRRYVEEFLGPSARYFNSGVMVIDLDRWRQKGYRKQALDFMRNRYLVLFADQDALNAVLQTAVCFIPDEWNYMPTLDAATSAARTKAAKIVHFAAFKPWRVRDQKSDLDGAYWTFAMSTPFGKRLRRHFFWDLQTLKAEARKQRAKLPLDHWPIKRVLASKSLSLLGAPFRRNA